MGRVNSAEFDFDGLIVPGMYFAEYRDDGSVVKLQKHAMFGKGCSNAWAAVCTIGRSGNRGLCW